MTKRLRILAVVTAFVLLLVSLAGCGGGGGTIANDPGGVTPRPVLILTDFRWSPASPVVGDEVTFRATVKNIGSAATPDGVKIGMAFAVNGQDVAWCDHNSGLAAGAAVQLTASNGLGGKPTWTASAGTFTVSAKVDKAELIQPNTTPQNTLVKTLSVNEPPPPPGEPHLIVTTFDWTPAEPITGDEIAFAATVENIGAAATPNGVKISVTFQVDGQKVTWCEGNNELAPGASLRLTATNGLGGKPTWTASAGTFTVSALVDEAELIQPNTTPQNTLAKTLTVAQPPDNRIIKIMCIGDSITAGAGSHTSYRYYLWKKLRDNGYTQIDFVGSQFGLWNGREPLDHDWDEDHESHSGWQTIDFLGARPNEGQLSGPNGWAATYQPDIALILLGTNDLGYARTPTETVADIGRMIDVLRGANPQVGIVLAQLTPARSDYDAMSWLTPEDKAYMIALNGSIGEYNQRIVSLANARNSASSPVTSVDLFSITDPVNDLADGLHPDDEANFKLATAWYPAVVALLNGSGR